MARMIEAKTNEELIWAYQIFISTIAEEKVNTSFKTFICYLYNPDRYYHIYLLEDNNDYPSLLITLEMIPDVCEIMYLATSPSKQRRHYASMLFDRFIKEKTKQGFDNMLLEVRVSNHKAISLYEKMQFKKLRIIKNYYDNEDGIAMQRILKK